MSEGAAPLVVPLRELPPLGPSPALVVGWALSGALATISFALYMPMLMLPPTRWLADDSDLVVLLAVGLAVASCLLGWRVILALPLSRRGVVRAGCALALAGACFTATYVHVLSYDLPRDEPLAVGERAPSIVGTDHEGRHADLRTYRGKPVLVIFFRGRW